MKYSFLLIGSLLFATSVWAADAPPQTHKRSKAHTDYRTYQAKDWEEEYKKREMMEQEKRQTEEEARQEKHKTMEEAEQKERNRNEAE